MAQACSNRYTTIKIVVTRYSELDPDEFINRDYSEPDIDECVKARIRSLMEDTYKRRYSGGFSSYRKENNGSGRGVYSHIYTNNRDHGVTSSIHFDSKYFSIVVAIADELEAPRILVDIEHRVKHKTKEVKEHDKKTQIIHEELRVLTAKRDALLLHNPKHK
jgi:hypothetical protein